MIANIFAWFVHLYVMCIIVWFYVHGCVIACAWLYVCDCKFVLEWFLDCLHGCTFMVVHCCLGLCWHDCMVGNSGLYSCMFTIAWLCAQGCMGMIICEWFDCVILSWYLKSMIVCAWLYILCTLEVMWMICSWSATGVETQRPCQSRKLQPSGVRVWGVKTKVLALNSLNGMVNRWQMQKPTFKFTSKVTAWPSEDMHVATPKSKGFTMTGKSAPVAGADNKDSNVTEDPIVALLNCNHGKRSIGCSCRGAEIKLAIMVFRRWKGWQKQKTEI